jgi:hypothetical protein
MHLITRGVTHPETAWLINLVPLCITIALVLTLVLIFRGPLLGLTQQVIARFAARKDAEPVDPALRWVPPFVTPLQLLQCCLLAALLALFALAAIGPLFMALLLAGPVTALVISVLLWSLRARYQAAIDNALPAAVARLSAQLVANNGIQQSLQLEWAFLLDHLGVPLEGGRLATPAQVVAALAAQTPSRRHRALLGQLEIALDQTHDVMVQRMQAASDALYAADRRRSAAATELAQMKYSGVAVGLAGVVMAAYLAMIQWERMQAAYTGTLGLIVGTLVVLALLAPVIGGVLLSRVEDLDY